MPIKSGTLGVWSRKRNPNTVAVTGSRASSTEKRRTGIRRSVY